MKTITVTCPDSVTAERRYAIETTVGEFLGVPCRVDTSLKLDHTVITRADAPGSIRLTDSLFAAMAVRPGELDAAVLPNSVEFLDLAGIRHVLESPETRSQASLRLTEDLPVFFPAEHGLTLQRSTTPDGGVALDCPVDIFGTVFFFLSRLEESVVRARDHHGRFKAADATLVRFGLVERPVVDETVELLRVMLNTVWPDMNIPVREGLMMVSCDVDQIRDEAYYSVKGVARRLVRDAVRQRSLGNCVASAATAVRIRSKGEAADPSNQLDWMMDVNDRAGTKCVFNFMAAEPTEFDNGYSLADPLARSMMKSVVDRGHEIGCHPSYRTVEDAALMQREYTAIANAAEVAGCQQSTINARQHYLRWTHERTPKDYEAMGVAVDSSVGFAETPGFRAGTGRPFYAWDFASRSALNIRIQPLVCMEVSVFEYQGRPVRRDDTIRDMCALRERTLNLGSDFGLLWHNNRLHAEPYRRAYETLLTR